MAIASASISCIKTDMEEDFVKDIEEDFVKDMEEDFVMDMEEDAQKLMDIETYVAPSATVCLQPQSCESALSFLQSSDYIMCNSV